MDVFFSIIIPVYNTARYLAACLDSVLSQNTDMRYEIICVNDGSTDESGDILEKYRNDFSSIRVITQENRGLSVARNVGMRNAKGDYILFLDSDDVLADHALQQMYEALDKNTDIDMLAFNSELWYADNTESCILPNVTFNHEQMIEYKQGMDYYVDFVKKRKWGPSAVCFYLFKRLLLIENRLEFEAGLLHEDELFVPQVMAVAGKTLTLPVCCYKYRMRNESITHSQTNKNALAKKYIAHELYELFKRNNKQNKYTDRVIFNLLFSSILVLRENNSLKFFEKKDMNLLRLTAGTFKERFKSRIVGNSMWNVYQLICKQKII